jgi:hypothetical protein
MKYRYVAWFVMCCALISTGLSAQTTGQEDVAGVRLLLIDETKTFISTMRVGALAGALKQMGMFDVSVKLVDVSSSYDDPLKAEQLDSDQEPFDVILVLPRGLDDGSVGQIWLATAGLEALAPTVRAGVSAASHIIDQVFQGPAEAIDVSEDLWPGLLAALYLKEGWLR